MINKVHQQFAQMLYFVSVLWLIAATCLVFAARTFEISWIFWLYLVMTLGMSAISFAVFGIDKSRAQKDRWRISERALHWLALSGGWPGAIIGRETFRHKTQKLTFRFLLPLFAAIHMLVIFVSLVLF